MQKLYDKFSKISANDKVAASLLKEVATNIENTLGTTVVIKFIPDNYDAERDIFCKEMIKQCELAETKSNSAEVLLLSNVLKANLYGCWHKPTGVRGTHPKAKECYETALRYAKTSEVEAEIRYRYALYASVGIGGSKELAINNFKRVIELVGETSELGVECAKEIAKVEQKKSGCFIATAVYGSPYENEVMVLKDFRDNWLLQYKLGEAFVKLYYWFSPSIANQIVKRDSLRKLTKTVLIVPLLKFANSINIKER